MSADLDDYALRYEYSSLILTTIAMIGFATNVETCLTPRLRNYLINTVIPDCIIYIDFDDDNFIKVLIVEFAPNCFSRGELEKFKIEIKGLVAECLNSNK